MPNWGKIFKTAGNIAMKTAQTVSQEAQKKSYKMQKDMAREAERYERQLSSLSNSEIVRIGKDENEPMVKRVAARNIAMKRKGENNFEGNPHYNQGKSNIKVGFILSAPGRLEENSGRPASGVTGNNLNDIISILRLSHPELFPTGDRYDYTITNAVTDIHYMSKTNSTEGKDRDVLNEENIKRILREISGLTHVFCLGSKATLLKDELPRRGFGGKVYLGPHLGLQSLNRSIKEDVSGNKLEVGDKDNTKKRLDVVADRLSKQIEE